jgi:hypothetical protein
MKSWIYCLVALVSLSGSSTLAHEPVDIDPNEPVTMDLSIRSAPEPFTFEQYISDLKTCARADQRDPSPFCQPEATSEGKYEPLNPFILKW